MELSWRSDEMQPSEKAQESTGRWKYWRVTQPVSRLSAVGQFGSFQLTAVSEQLRVRVGNDMF